MSIPISINIYIYLYHLYLSICHELCPPEVIQIYFGRQNEQSIVSKYSVLYTPTCLLSLYEIAEVPKNGIMFSSQSNVPSEDFWCCFSKLATFVFRLQQYFSKLYTLGELSVMWSPSAYLLHVIIDPYNRVPVRLFHWALVVIQNSVNCYCSRERPQVERVRLCEHLSNKSQKHHLQSVIWHKIYSKYISLLHNFCS